MTFSSFFRTSALAAVVLGGCSVVYPIQYVPSSPLTVDYKNDSYTFQVVDLTPSSALEANSLWSYQPRRLPEGMDVPSTLQRKTAFRATSLGTDDCETDDCILVAQVAQSIDEPVQELDDFEFRPPPRSLPQPYKVGVGDVFTVTIESINDGASTAFQREAIVDYAGNIYLTDVGEVNVLAMTVAEARQAVADRFRDSRVAANGSVTITGFNSQKVIVAAPGTNTTFLPITTTPITLRDAYLQFSSGIDTDARRQVVVMRRGNEQFPIRGRDVLRQSYGYEVYLRDGDEIQIFDSYLNNVPSAAISPEVLALNQSRQAEARFERQEQRATREERRAEAALARAEREFQFAQERFNLARIEAERADRAEARAAAAEDRQLRAETRLDSADARAQRDEARRDTAEARALRDEARQDAAEIRAAREEVRSERASEIAEDRLKSERFRDRLANRADKRADISTLQQLSSVKQDRIFIGGETEKQQTIPLPFERQFTLAEAIYGSDGIEPITGDPSKVYVVRAKSTVGQSIESYIFQFDHANLANTAAMTMFEMRPNDYVVVLPRKITNFSRFINQLLPSFSTVLSAARI